MAEQDKNLEQKNETQGSEEVQFLIHKVYVKDISFETPNSPEIFKMPWQPEVDMNLSNKATPMGDDHFDVVLSITLTVKLGDQIAYLIEVDQAGIFLLKNLPEDVISRTLGVTCANILFPFVRETMADVITRGGFPQLLLAPVNFDALYEQQSQAATIQAGPSSTTH